MSSIETDSAPSSFTDRPAFRLGRWRVVPAELLLADGDEEVRLQQREMALLLALCDGGRTPTSSEQVRRLVWGDQAITDGAAKNLIWQLRRSLGETAQEPELIETVPGAGYRLTAEPRPVEERSDEDALTVSGEGEAEKAPSLESVPPAAAGKPAAGRDAAPLDSAPLDEDLEPARRSALFLLAAAIAGILALLGIASLVSERDDEPASIEAASIEAAYGGVRPVTGLPGREHSISLDPSGRHLLFSWSAEVNGQSDLYRFDLEDPNATPIRLTSTEETWEFHSRFSPDGRRIAYVSGRRGTATQSVEVIPATGGVAKSVVTLRTGTNIELAWDVSGEALFLTWWPDLKVGHRIHRLPLDTARPEPLFEPPPERTWDRTPAVSPDGTELVFSRWSAPHHGELRRLHLETGEEELVATLSGGTLGSLAWSGDSRSLLFTARHPGRSSTVFTMPADGSAEPSLYAPTSGSLDIGEVTAAAGSVVFEQSDYDVDILRFDALFAESPTAAEPPKAPPGTWVAPSDRADFSPQLSPDGRRLAFLSDRGGGFELWLEEAGEVRRLAVEGVTPSSHPRWSPNGELIALAVVRGGQRDLVVVRPGDGPGGHTVELVTDTPVREMSPSWRRDGLALRFLTPSPEAALWEQELWRPESRRRIAERGAGAMELADGRLLYTNPEGLMLRETGGASRRLEIPGEAWPGGNWDATADGVFLAPTGRRTIYFHRFSDGSTRAVLELDYPIARYGLEVAADGSLLVSVVVRDSSRILMLEGRQDAGS